MTTVRLSILFGLALTAFAPTSFSQTVVLYQNNFEKPNPGSLARTCGYALDQRGINYLFGPGATNGGSTGTSAPATFQQTFTVEGVLNYPPAPANTCGHNYVDSLGIGGLYSLGMLKNAQEDRLSMTFNTQGKPFLNFSVDISAIDVCGCGGPFNVGANLEDPRFQLRLLSTPGGAFNINTYLANNSAYPLLDEKYISGPRGPDQWTFLWTNHIVSLDASGAPVDVNGNSWVTLVWDLQASGYAAFDNFIIAASSNPGDIGQNHAPTANAGPDQSVDEFVTVYLNGSGSTDPDAGDILSYTWTQIGGPTVTLNDPTTAHPYFTAPDTVSGATLTFQLVVNDGLLNSEPATVNIAVANVNHAPVADAGTDQTVQEGNSVTLHGENSYDPDDNTITYSWTQTAGPSTITLNGADTPTPTFATPLVGPLGETYTFSLTVSDGSLSHTDSVSIFVTNVNNPPSSNAGLDQTVNENTAVVLDGTASSDPDGDSLSYLWEQVSGPPVGLSDSSSPNPTFSTPNVVAMSNVVVTFRLTVSDGLGGTSADTVAITVQDTNAAPLCNLARPSSPSLWPPNHKLVEQAIVGVTDPDNANVTISILSVTQDEPINGLGDGDTSPDAVRKEGSVLLRAERSGLGDGRVYRVEFRADDGVGGSCTGTVKVCVPHDQSPKKATCIDSGGVYNSLLR